jgi:hypothetical protein
MHGHMKVKINWIKYNEVNGLIIPALLADVLKTLHYLCITYHPGHTNVTS